MTNFSGFTKNGITFLKDLAINNNKDWFESNRNIYEKYVFEPLKQLAADLGPVIRKIDPHIETAPAVNKTISRIYRDVRFSNDKSPFRTDLWISFKRPRVWGNVPEFYFYFTPEDYQYGMGFYSATPANMEKIRVYTLSDPERLTKILDSYKSSGNFTLKGENYKKPVPNPLPEAYQEWFRKKNLFMSCQKKIDKTFFSDQLKESLEKGFLTNADLYRFIIEAIYQESKIH